MSEEKRLLKVFLCHTHADREAVKALYNRLTADGVDAWLDKEKLLPGQEWELEIRKAVREADVVVVCLSKQFNQAGFRQKEVRLALDTAMEKPEGEIFIIPARLEECDNLESLGKWHWVDLFEGDGYGMLVRALCARADKIGAALQIKKNWLPKVSTQPAAVKKPSSPMGKPKSKKENQTPRTFNKSIVGIVGFFILALVAIFGLRFLIGKLVATPTATSTLTKVVLPTSTPIVFNPRPAPSDYIDAFGVPMRLVPAGEFTMGENATDAIAKCESYNKATNCDALSTNQEPPHQVYLEAFTIDKFEITNVLYKACVDVGVCKPPIKLSSYSDSNYYGDPEFANYPVVYVDWNMAKTYCEWRGARLPTEAEWEKAARGTDIRIFPWGEEFPWHSEEGRDGEVLDCQTLNFDVCDRGTTEIGSFETVKSPYGIYDMAGNVWEWVADNYSDEYYEESPYANPKGPLTGTFKIVRGGSSSSQYWEVASIFRGYKFPDSAEDDIGFRCTKDVTP